MPHARTQYCTSTEYAVPVFQSAINMDKLIINMDKLINKMYWKLVQCRTKKLFSDLHQIFLPLDIHMIANRTQYVKVRRTQLLSRRLSTAKYWPQ